MDYFNNSVICDLIEKVQKNKVFTSILNIIDTFSNQSWEFIVAVTAKHSLVFFFMGVCLHVQLIIKMEERQESLSTEN